MDDMERSCPEHTLLVPCDISQVDSFDNALESIIRKHRHIDLAIICAGIGELNPKLDVETELSTVSVNVMGLSNTVASIYRLFERQK